jgi:hypothetical protein
VKLGGFDPEQFLVGVEMSESETKQLSAAQPATEQQQQGQSDGWGA